MTEAPRPARPGLSTRGIAAAIVIAAGGYALAFATTWGAAAVLVAMPALFTLARAATPRRAFYGGLAAGLAVYVPHLWFFAALFRRAAIPIWFIAAVPVATFALLGHLVRRRWGDAVACCLAPVLWTGVEFFRSELYALRFAWLLPGQAMAFLPGARMLWLGVYGVGFLYAVAATLLIARSLAARAVGAAVTLALAALMYWPAAAPTPARSDLQVAGVQFEFPYEDALVDALDRLAVAHPEAQLLVLSEYTFLGPVPPAVRDVVRRHGRYLVAGAKHDLPDGKFYDVAVVIGPDGKDLFEQGKSVPVQFMDDGLPAPSRRVWQSPWGPIGLAVCYDVSYARVMDDFVRQGARGLIVPTMDLESWGGYERRMLHGRMAPVRSAEYGLSVLGVWSSGTSQLTDRAGHVIATAGFPGQGETIAGPFDVSGPGHVPIDRWLAMGASILTAGTIAWLAADHLWPSRRVKGSN